MADLVYGHRDAVTARMAQMSTMIQETYLDDITQQIFYDDPVIDRFNKNKKTATAMDQQVRVMKSAYGGAQFWDDLDDTTVAQQYTRDTVTYNLKKLRIPIYVSDADAKTIAQGGDPSKSEIFENLLTDVKDTVADLLGYLKYIGCSQSLWNPRYGSTYGGSGSISAALAKGPDGLCAVAPYYDQTTDTTSRTFAGVAVVPTGASAANTYWQPQCIYNSTPPSVSLGVIYRLISQVKRRGRANPKMVVMPGAPWDALADIIGAFQSTVFKDSQNPGLNSFSLRGVDVFCDPHCPSGSADQPDTLNLGYTGVQNPLKFGTSTYHMVYAIDEEIGFRMYSDAFDWAHMYEFEDTKMTGVWSFLGWLSYQWQWISRKRSAVGCTLVQAA